MPEAIRTIQYGKHINEAYAALGVREPLTPDDTKIFHNRLQQQAFVLGLECELIDDIPTTSHDHTLIRIPGLVVRLNDLAVYAEALVSTLVGRAVLDPHLYCELDEKTGLFMREQY